MAIPCLEVCPIANKERAVVATIPDADIKSFPEGFALPDPITATPESILLFLEYQKRIIGITMHEQAGEARRGANLTARRLMLTITPPDATVKCGLDHQIAESKRWENGGTGSISIRGGVDCPYLPDDAFVFGGVTARIRTTT